MGTLDATEDEEAGDRTSGSPQRIVTQLDGVLLIMGTAIGSILGQGSTSHCNLKRYRGAKSPTE